MYGETNLTVGDRRMAKRVLDVGNCSFDHSSIRRMIESSFDAVVLRARDEEDALATLFSDQIDLVLVNRRLDADRSDGIEILKRIKENAELAAIPAMVVTNYPEHQQRAVEAGAEWGFGKEELDAPETIEKLKRILG